MPVISFPYGKKTKEYQINEAEFKGELVSKLHSYQAAATQEELVAQAFAMPVGTKPLHELVKDKQKVVIIASDHTRPVPSKIIIPPMLAAIRKGNPTAEITILIATGCHRDATRAELEEKFGKEIVEQECIINHNCDTSEFEYCGKLPSGGYLLLNKLAVKADLLVAEGFIEPHFFAGYSGGRKSVLPGVASRNTVLYNHNAEFIANECARTGRLEQNPIHEDMLFAARKVGLDFICNVVINANKEVIYAVAGDCEQAHEQGCEFLERNCKVERVLADIVITSNGGYPLDQNIYQAVKGMTAAEATVKRGGVIIMLAQSCDGHGAPEFYQTFKEEKDLDRMLSEFWKTPKETTKVDQWQSQIFARVLQHAKVIYISDTTDEMVRDMHMIPAHSIAEAMEIAKQILGNPQASVVAIPDGVSIIITGNTKGLRNK